MCLELKFVFWVGMVYKIRNTYTGIHDKKTGQLCAPEMQEFTAIIQSAITPAKDFTRLRQV